MNKKQQTSADPKATDRNFDDLAEKFERNIYGTLKGQLRLKILDRDLQELLSKPGALSILDAGCGSAQYAASLAAKGHQITGCDISGKMLQKARNEFNRTAPKASVKLIHAPLQSLEAEEAGQFDLILMHGVLEWLAEPKAAIGAMLGLLRPGGEISILVYNHHALVMRSLMLGNLGKILHGHLFGWKKSLTPTNPQNPASIFGWAENMQLKLIQHSGVRCFIDYVPRNTHHVMTEADIVETELQLSQQDPYRSIARYVHLLFRR